jgi:hypothetical protein
LAKPVFIYKKASTLRGRNVEALIGILGNIIHLSVEYIFAI